MVLSGRRWSAVLVLTSACLLLALSCGGEAELDLIERGNANHVTIRESTDQQPALVGQLERFQNLGARIDQPQVLHICSRIDLTLFASIIFFRRRRQDLADPIG